MDNRLKKISYSSLLTLHECPRKFQLYRLNAETQQSDEDVGQSLTFLFGHVVGEGVQLALTGATEDEIIWTLFRRWDMDLFECSERQNKSFFLALRAVSLFQHTILGDLLADYGLVIYDSKPAIELGFQIFLPGGFVYRGFVDAVLRHKHTGEVIVLEIKTTSSRAPDPAQYKNSSQAIGYSVVLDHIFKGLSSYKVMYLPYLTKECTFAPMEFTKSFVQRAAWLQDLYLDTKIIEMYDDIGLFPGRGESCYKFFRECEYFNLCTLSTDKLITEAVEQEDDSHRYQFQIDFNRLIDTQLINATQEG